MSGEDGLLAVLREGHRAEWLLDPALFHTGRAQWHTAHGDAGDGRFFLQHALDVFRRHMPLDDVAADLGGVARDEIARHARLDGDDIQLRVADVVGFHLEAPRPDMFNPGAAAPSRWRLVDDHRGGRRLRWRRSGRPLVGGKPEAGRQESGAREQD